MSAKRRDSIGSFLTSAVKPVSLLQVPAYDLLLRQILTAARTADFVGGSMVTDFGYSLFRYEF